MNPRNIPRDMFLGIYRGPLFLGIFRGFISSEFSDENSAEHFVGTSEVNSEDVLPRYIPRTFSLGIFRGDFRRTCGPRSFLGNWFPRNSVGKFRVISEENGISEDLFCRRNRTTYRSCDGFWDPTVHNFEQSWIEKEDTSAIRFGGDRFLSWKA
ncbi:hypothetical protein DY000_02004227 [Brassica cretica]|uniref:Uncharacterized protein n=1 Tax=Brassica cretica TaxID=69181 RepID=A0ABQ7CCP2_BRACR|nr:hypothetical protein DY000_02004227 [Brassica cretica]